MYNNRTNKRHAQSYEIMCIISVAATDINPPVSVYIVITAPDITIDILIFNPVLALIIVDVAVIWTAAAMNKAIIDIIAVRIYGALPNLLLIISGISNIISSSKEVIMVCRRLAPMLATSLLIRAAEEAISAIASSVNSNSTLSLESNA